MGTITSNNHLQLTDEFQSKSWMKRRLDMQDIRLRVNLVILKKLEEPLEVLLHAHTKPSREYLSRAAFALLNIIKDMFNLT